MSASCWGRAVHIYPGLLLSYWRRKAYLTKIDQVSKRLNRYSRSIWLPNSVTSTCTFRVPHTLPSPAPSRSLSLFFFPEHIRTLSLVFLPRGFPHKWTWVHRLEDEWLVTSISGSFQQEEYSGFVSRLRSQYDLGQGDQPLQGSHLWKGDVFCL